MNDYRKYLTKSNVAVVVALIAITALIIILFSRSPKKQADEGIKALQAQNKALQDQLEQIKRDGETVARMVEESRREDSIKIATYEARIWKDYQTIENLKKKRDERIKDIGSASDSELLRILAGHE